MQGRRKTDAFSCNLKGLEFIFFDSLLKTSALSIRDEIDDGAKNYDKGHLYNFQMAKLEKVYAN